MEALRSWLPRGRTLPAQDWEWRHQAILVLLAGHAVGLFVFGMYMSNAAVHTLLETGSVLVFAGLAWMPLGRRWRSVASAAGLATASALLVHFSGGYIEAHFHFFIMMGIIALYEDWAPFLLSIAYVALHHGIVGTLEPTSVYNHPAALAQPWLWAGIHAIFILGMAGALVFFWRTSEVARNEVTKEIRRTERARAEAQAQEVQVQALEALNTARTEFVAMAAHEMRTPLGPMKAELMMLADQTAQEGQESIQALRENLDRLTRFVDDLLTASRLEHGHLSIKVAPTDVAVVIQDAVDACRPVADAAGVALDVAVQPATVQGDRHRLEQLFMNLLSNAIRATPEGGRVSVSLAVDEAVRIEVTDTGKGIAPGDIPRLFLPFSRLSLDGAGTGLGLYVCRHIADAHGARIGCQSDGIGRGATFWVELPLVRVLAA